MREVVLIGIGAGDPRWITLEAVDAINSIDVLFVVVKEDEYEQPVAFRRELIARHRSPELPDLRIVELADPHRPWRTTPDYPAAVRTWRRQRFEQWGAAIEEGLTDGETGGFLVWGDPSLYESTLAIVQRIADGAPAEHPLSLRVIPGISCVLALAARHQIPLNRQGKAVQISPARLLADGVPPEVDDVVVMLDGKQTFHSIDPTGLDIYWGAYLGTPDEILISGPLAEVRDEVLRVRAEASERKGWMFDTYLLRRSSVD